MRKDHRPYWLRKLALAWSGWYTQRFLRPACDDLGDHHHIMRPWYVAINGPHIRIGQCVTMVASPSERIQLTVWGRSVEQGSIQIGDYVLISPGVRISASDAIVIGDNVMIANGVYITDCDWHGVYDRTRRDDAVTPVTIRNNVWLGDGCKVLKGVTIGENSIVAAGAIVSKDVPANVVVAGNPAVVVKELDAGVGFRTRGDFYRDPVVLQDFFAHVEKSSRNGNTFWGWLRSCLTPTHKH